MKELSRLEELYISEDTSGRNGFGDSGMRIIGGFSELRELHLERNSVVDYGSRYLGKLKKLRRLAFRMQSLTKLRTE